MRARLVYREDGGITWLSTPGSEELDKLSDSVADAGLLARLDNPISLGSSDDEVPEVEPKKSLYTQEVQQYRSGNEWKQRKAQAVDNFNTIEQAALTNKQIGKLRGSLDGLLEGKGGSGDGEVGSGGTGLGTFGGGDAGYYAQAPTVMLGVPEPLWLGERLVVTRIARRSGTPEVHVSWLDLDRLRAELLAEIDDLLPNAELLPATTGDTTRMLATLPLRLEPGPVATALPPSWSPLRASLVVGWVFVLLATAAVAGLMLWSLSLSERRAAFVSAVTHELRTPLTTFRMYTEMLSEGMVEEKRDRYVATLRREADRLGHLVENVLSYARIEGGRSTGTLESLDTTELVARVERRLAERCAEAGMELEVELDDDPKKVRVDPTAAEQILFNLVDNAAKYAPSKEDPRIVLSVRGTEFRVRDFGPGIPDDERRKIFEPFAKGNAHAAGTKPGVGLGLALCRRLARQMKGDLRVEPAEPGAVFVLTL